MEIHHNVYRGILYIVIITIISIIGFLSISISANKQHIIVDSSLTIGTILIAITGILLSTYLYQQYNNNDETHKEVSPTTQYLYTTTAYIG
jgi:hypothetical protein